jgi:predicted dehydrogenase
MKTLVIGLGMGQLYVKVLKELGHEVITVDPDRKKNADYNSLHAALRTTEKFGAAFICTPNSTHSNLAKLVADHCRILFVEKPGLKSTLRWEFLQQSHPNTRILMIKNNMWRTVEEEMRIRIDDAEEIHINWINRNRVPAPGSWFTDKKLSFGGVSKDLMPHLLSIFLKFNPDKFKDFKILSSSKKQNWKLNDLTDTEYGSINLDGVYNVDDWNQIVLTDNNKKYVLTADWRNMNKDDRAIHCYKRGELIKSFELGLCPESAYAAMIQDVFNNIKNEEFWNQHKQYDVWIHNLIND